MTNSPQKITGKKHQDQRGTITYNNDFDASAVKRIYTIQNATVDGIRGWQGHKIEQRWFASMLGEFKISVIHLDDFENRSTNLAVQTYLLSDETLSILHVPPGCITAIQALKPHSKLLVLADYKLGEIQDEYRFEIDYFCHFKR